MAENAKIAWSGKSRGGRIGYLFFVFLIKTFGLGCAYTVLAFVSAHFVLFAPKATAAIWRYNRRVLGYGVVKSVVELYRHYYLFGQTIVDKIAIRGGMADRFQFEFDNYERFIEIINGRSGVIIIGAHVGCWQAGSAFFGKYGKRINIVMFDAEHDNIRQVLDKNTSDADFKVIPVNKGSIESMIAIKVALNSGEYVCFNGDRYIDKNSAVECGFCGADASFPSGPFVIASKCRVPVVFYYAMREPGRKYRFIFSEVQSENALDSHTLLTEYVHSLEGIVRRYPRQWFNFYRFWNN